jgi:hypothetical protein
MIGFLSNKIQKMFLNKYYKISVKKVDNYGERTRWKQTHLTGEKPKEEEIRNNNNIPSMPL